MPAVYQIRFLFGGETQELCGSRGNYYELPNSTHITLSSSPVWCRLCNEFTEGESIEAIEAIDQQIADLWDPTSELFQFYKDSSTSSIGVDGIHFISELEKRRRWRESRQSPPKCLGCGSPEIVLLPEGQKVTNPTGRGWIEVTVTGLCSTPFMNRYYTTEGDRIPKDTKPTYWTLRWLWELDGQQTSAWTVAWPFSRPNMTEFRNMSQYIRREFRRWGKEHLDLFIHGHLAFPYMLIDRQRKHLGVSCSFEWWADDERFYCGFPSCIFILDCRDQTYTVRSAGWDEEGVRVVITAPIEMEISNEELKTTYRATCRRSGRKLLDLDDILSRKEFVQRVADGRRMAIGGSE
jgi:hypothetical protein